LLLEDSEDRLRLLLYVMPNKEKGVNKVGCLGEAKDLTTWFVLTKKGPRDG